MTRSLATIISPEGLLRGPWNERLEYVSLMMRQMSSQTDPQVMVREYRQHMRHIYPSDGFISLSRRGLDRPRVRITRSHTWDENVNPWTTNDKTFLDGGLLSELIWNEDPLVIDDLQLSRSDPGEPFLAGMRSLAAIPLYDQGKALNMIVAVNREPGAFNREDLPERLWMSNLFGRATQNLVLSDELRRAYESVDRELKIVQDMQRSLLPKRLPDIPGLALATHYQTSRRAGGDYYDFFELPDGLWGILIADVSGHGTPAAVMMAITHSIAHAHTGPATPPSALLSFINRSLSARYTTDTGTFVTAFYGIYNPRTRRITYASAGHCPPRVKRFKDGRLISLERALALPLGIDPDEHYHDAHETLDAGDALVLYTDGITEARKPGASELFGLSRLDAVLNACACDAHTLIRSTLDAVNAFVGHAPPIDDQTLLIAKVHGY